MTLRVIESRPTRVVPCGSCTTCCQSDAIYLHPECGDDHHKYQCELADDGRLMLAHKPNGDCIYLDRDKGCMNWENRPTVCREFDCRALYRAIGEKKMKNLGLGAAVKAAKRLIAEGKGAHA